MSGYDVSALKEYDGELVAAGSFSSAGGVPAYGMAKWNGTRWASLSFTGGGIDTEGGLNTAVFSACTNTTTNLVFDLKATDTYVNTGDQVFIEGESFVQVINPANCTASNSHGVDFIVAGGTGAYAGATGKGKFNLFSNLTPCNGQVAPAQVSFEGWIKRAQ